MYRSKAYSKYKYLGTSMWLTRFVYLFGILTWAGVFYGYLTFFNLGKIYWFTFAPIIFAFSSYYVISYGINLFYHPFNLRRHYRFLSKYWKEQKIYPPVDIFLPICGESTAVIHKTFLAASKIDYQNKKIYVLDDKGDKEHKVLARTLGFAYLSRKNKGYMKKSGNLKYGFENSNGDFIVVFDADFAPHKDFIHDLLPYMRDKSIAILQSPQYFETSKNVHKRSALEFGAGYVQENFYRIIQVARDYFGGAVCVGSNAIYRREALNDIGGPVQIEHSEDVYTGFELINKGWKLKYLPLILSIGLCPDNMQTYFYQQSRWASGSMKLMLDKKFWKSKIPFATKICFVSGFLYYITHFLDIPMSFQVFVLLFGHYSFIDLKHALPFLPYLFWTLIILPLFGKTKFRYGVLITRVAHTYSYGHAIISGLFKKPLIWKPTGANEMPRVSSAYMALIAFNAAYLLVYAVCIAIAIIFHKLPIFNINYYGILFWVYYNLISHFLFLFYNFKFFDLFKQEKIKEKILTRNGLRIWRLKTIGAYTLVLVAILATAVIYNP